MSMRPLLETDRGSDSLYQDAIIQVHESSIGVSALSAYVEKVFVDEVHPQETCCHWTIRKIVQVVAPLIACAAKLSFIALSVDAAGSNAVLAGFLAYGNVTAFSIIIGWCALSMIHDLMSPKHAEEKVLEESRVPAWAKVAIATSSFVLGLFAQFSLAYLVYVYNNNNLLMPIAVMISDPWFPVYSTWCGLTSLAKQRTHSPIEKEIIQVKNDHISGLQDAQDELNLISERARSSFRERLGNVGITSESKASDYTKEMLARKVEVIPRPSSLYKVIEKVVFAIGLVFLFSQYLVIIYTGFAGWKLIWDQKVFDGFMTAIVLGSYLYITGVSIPNAMKRLFNLAYGLICCNYQPTLAQKSAPVLATLLTLLTLFTTSLSWGPNKEIAKDYFSGWLQTAMLVTAPASVVLLTTAIVLIVADIALEHYVARFKDEDARADMKLKWKYDEYIRVLKNCSTREYAKFLKTIPHESLDNISPKAKALVGRLDIYLTPTENTSLA